MSLVIGNHAFVGINFLNNKGTNISFEMVRIKNCFVKMFFGRIFHIYLTGIVKEIITELRLFNFVDMLQSMNGIVR